MSDKSAGPDQQVLSELRNRAEAWRDTPDEAVKVNVHGFDAISHPKDDALTFFFDACEPEVILALLDEVQTLRTARELVDEQAEDEACWFIADTMPEAYLQQELRRLHAAIEAPS